MARIPKHTGRPLKWTDEKIESLGKELEAWFHADDENCFYKSFFGERPDLYPEMISEFSSVNEAFSQTIKRIELLQQKRLVKLGSTKGMNPAMAIFLLKANHGYKEVQHIESNQNITTKQSSEQLKALSEPELKELVRGMTEDRASRG